MKKKLLSFLFTLCLMLSFPFVLTACGGVEHTHEYATTWIKDATSHWYACKGEDCKETKDKANHNYNVDTCSVCGYVDSNKTPATVQSMDTYFSGIKAEYLKSNFTGANGTATFEELLDTQIDVLAQDILYRLTSIYGANSDNIRNTLTNYSFKTLNGQDYKLNNSFAKILSQEILGGSEITTHNSHNITWGADLDIDLNCINCLQELINSSASPNFLYYISSIDFTSTIEGGRTTLEPYVSNLSQLSIEENAWNWWNSSMENSTYEIYSNAYKNNFKMAIAQMLTNSSVTGIFNLDNYNNLLGAIDSLGYSSEIENKIVDFIKTNVVGTGLIQKDNLIYNCNYFSSINHKIGISFISTAPFENGQFTTEEVMYSPRLYKGYNIVIPAIVEQALANTFEGTNISLYPKMSRTAFETTTTATGFNTAKEYQTITLMPKADAVSTKLVVKLTGVGSSIGQKIVLDYNVVINGTNYNGSQNITLTANVQEVELNLSSITSGATFGAYNGTTTSHTSCNAFDNNDFDLQGNVANNDGNNYIKLDFNNSNNYSFIVTFGGMYNK